MLEEYLDDAFDADLDTEVTAADFTKVLHNMKFFKSTAIKSILF